MWRPVGLGVSSHCATSGQDHTGPIASMAAGAGKSGCLARHACTVTRRTPARCASSTTPTRSTERRSVLVAVDIMPTGWHGGGWHVNGDARLPPAPSATPQRLCRSLGCWKAARNPDRSASESQPLPGLGAGRGRPNLPCVPMIGGSPVTSVPKSVRLENHSSPGPGAYGAHVPMTWPLTVTSVGTLRLA